MVSLKFTASQTRPINQYENLTIKTKMLCQISPNCNYCILFDVCCVLTVHNIV